MEYFYIKIIKFTLCADASLAIALLGPLKRLIVIACIVTTNLWATFMYDFCLYI